MEPAAAGHGRGTVPADAFAAEVTATEEEQR